MKNILKTALFALSLAFIAAAVGGCESAAADDGIIPAMPADASEIAGPEGFYDGETATLTIEEIPYADSYKWYKGNDEIADATGLTLTVSEEGIYRVAGVNEAGEGKASPAKSIRQLTFTDRWVGEWACTERWIEPGQNGAADALHTNDHTVTIIRTGDLDEHKIAIVNFFEANPPGTYTAFANTILWNGQIQAASGDTVVAVIDELNETMQIPTGWLMTPSWMKGFNTALCPLIYDSSYADNVGEDFPPQKFVEEEDGTIRMVMETGPIMATVGSQQIPFTYMIALTSNAQGYETLVASAIGTVWTKIK